MEVSYPRIGTNYLCVECMTEVPVTQLANHATTTRHRTSLACRHRPPPKNHYYCNLCKRDVRGDGKHETGASHKKALILKEKYDRLLEDGGDNSLRHSWELASSYTLKDHMAKDDKHGASLLEPFAEEANELFYNTSESISSMIRKGKQNGEKDLLLLLQEIRKLESGNSSLKQMIIATYNRILQSTKDKETSNLWLLKHNYSSANELLGVLKDAGDEILEIEGFWIVQDNRKSGRVSNPNNDNNGSSSRASNPDKIVSRILAGSDMIEMKFESSHFGASSREAPIAASNQKGVPFYMHKFIVISLALDKAIDLVMEAFIGDEANQDVFREALFYNVPSTHKLFYDADLDFNHSLTTMRLGLYSGQSLMSSGKKRKSHLRVDTLDDYGETAVELYKFDDIQMEHILEGDCKIAHNIPLVDDGFGACVRAWVQDGIQPTDGGFLRVIRGVTRGAVVTSMFGSRTSIHVEDGMLATFNLLVIGAPKIWYIVPNSTSVGFRKFLKGKGLLKPSFRKRCFVEAFSTGSNHSLSVSELEKFDVRRVVQYPGMTVMTIPGEIFHWTISTGFSLADTVNYYCDYSGGKDLKELRELWNTYKAASGNPTSASTETSNQYFDMCQSFGLL